MTFDFRTRRFGAAVLGVTFLGGMAAGTLTVNPAAAAGIVSAVTTVSCSVTGSNWCISGNNSNSGIGVIGTSKTGTGLRGTSTSQYGLKATSSSGTAILAQTTSGPTAIDASGGKNGYGLTTTGFFGAYANGTLYGLYGSTPSGSGYRVGGIVTGTGTGVFGKSNSGYGVEAYSSSNDAVSARSGSDLDHPTISSVATNVQGIAGYFNANYVGVLSQTSNDGYPLFAENGYGDNIFDVDGAGIHYVGNLYHDSAPRPWGHESTLVRRRFDPADD